jgi:hypothetical protein
MNPSAETLAAVELGQRSSSGTSPSTPGCALRRDPGYVLLDDALARKLARVTEVSESGSVPELLFYNDGDEDILLLDGEELVGAKQNRILNVSILVGGKQRVAVPVSCVEQGAGPGGRGTSTARSAPSARARAKKMRRVSESAAHRHLRFRPGRDLERRSRKLSALNAPATGSMGDAQGRAGTIDEYVRALEAIRTAGRRRLRVGRKGGRSRPLGFRARLPQAHAEARSQLRHGCDRDACGGQAPVGEEVRKFLEDMKAAAPALPRGRKGEQLRLEAKI